MDIKISTPTISRFESGDRDIQVSSVTRILGVLGMLDERTLAFADTHTVYDPMREVVLFEGKDGDKVLLCAISREALDDHYGGDKKNKLKVFHANRDSIEHEARRKYLAASIEPDGSIFISSDDLS